VQNATRLWTTLDFDCEYL